MLSVEVRIGADASEDEMTEVMREMLDCLFASWRTDVVCMFEDECEFRSFIESGHEPDEWLKHVVEETCPFS